MTARYGEIGFGGNSGFQAVNLAVQFGAKRIILVGFDFHQRYGSHWHGDHNTRDGLKNPQQRTLDGWRLNFEANSAIFEDLGVEVILGTSESALQSYPVRDLEALLDDIASERARDGAHASRETPARSASHAHGGEPGRTVAA